MSDVQEASAQSRECPVCGSLCEPEVEGDLRWWECDDEGCEAGGYQFGWERWLQPQDDACSLGVPEDVRRAASRPMEAAQAQEAAAQPVSLGPTIGRRPGL